MLSARPASHLEVKGHHGAVCETGVHCLPAAVKAEDSVWQGELLLQLSCLWTHQIPNGCLIIVALAERSAFNGAQRKHLLSTREVPEEGGLP